MKDEYALIQLIQPMIRQIQKMEENFKTTIEVDGQESEFIIDTGSPKTKLLQKLSTAKNFAADRNINEMSRRK